MSWNRNFEVTFSILNEDGSCSSNNSYITTYVSAFNSNQAEAMIRGQYGRNCQIHSCYQRD